MTTDTYLRKVFKEIDNLVSAGRNEVKELKNKDDDELNHQPISFGRT